MTETPIDTFQKNINLETVENCNLLCKLILDYMDTDKCTIQRLPGQSFRIVYPPGSFINHKDTNYELIILLFTRHSISRNDLEINLYQEFYRSNNNKKNSSLHIIIMMIQILIYINIFTIIYQVIPRDHIKIRILILIIRILLLV